MTADEREAQNAAHVAHLAAIRARREAEPEHEYRNDLSGTVGALREKAYRHIVAAAALAAEAAALAQTSEGAKV